MALRVGMRVKQVLGDDAGATGVVVGFDVFTVAQDYDIVIQHDGYGIDDDGLLYSPGEWLDCRAFEWEPIQPEGHKPVEWSQCLWQPEHIREGVSA